MGGEGSCGYFQDFVEEKKVQILILEAPPTVVEQRPLIDGPACS